MYRKSFDFCKCFKGAHKAFGLFFTYTADFCKGDRIGLCLLVFAHIFNGKAVDVTTKNLKNCGLFDKARVVNMVSQDFLRTTKDNFDIVFLDPPYNMGILDEILPKVCEVTAEDGIIIAESELGWKPAEIEGLKLKKQYKYGKVLVSKFQKESL